MEAEAKFGRDARPARPWSCGTHGLAVLVVVSALCICTAWADMVDATRMAAEKGNAAAQCQMGLFYMNGLGVDRDEDKAVEWLKKAAAQNHA